MGSAQWIVRPQPGPRCVGEGSRSKTRKGTLGVVSDWARVKPVMPAPMMRIGREGGVRVADMDFLDLGDWLE